MNHHPERQLWVKRFIDETVASLLLVVLSPLIGGIALLLWVTMGRPLLFRQKRSGLNGRPFQIIKFRTMTDKHDSSGRALPDEMRLTAVGRFLRATSLDELPELWNVTRGELSLVGPRPLMARYLERYSPEQARRHEVMQGITGWAQINGRNDLPWEQKFALDVWYADHWSLGLDFRILVKTFWHVLKRDGICPSDHASVPEFTGNGSLGESERPLQCK
ncbi:MAG: sugar transferase [Ignavibacteria bacterium]|nr:MAG: sugar transferase [Ignavibacteria bacterium]